MDTPTLVTVLSILQKESKSWDVPIVTLIADQTSDPFRVLITTILSLRTKDETTTDAARRLFARAAAPDAILSIPREELSSIIYPVGFYKQKAKSIHAVCRILIDEHGGTVPANLDTLLTFPGVGRKTANLVLTLGFGIDAICVDTHVHRISNRFGYVRTKTPEETEFALRDILPREWWIPINDILVAFGQSLCRPVSPWCSRCPVERYCEKVRVGKRR
ncbi:endonuclease III [bacterium]|nr:endonuclease III [bacterium]